ncbi:MAG: acyltransferase family protein [Formivibrio sp.]|nr:acyltransferase family protein [Formivibrio sp.]
MSQRSANTSTSGHLDWVDGTRTVAALAVVLLHAAASAVTDRSLLGSSGWWAANVFDAATRWCVPVFVMLSGALLLVPSKAGESWRDFYRRRFVRVLIPLVFWSLFYLAYDLCWVLDRGGEADWLFMLHQTLIGMPYFHLWFLFMLPGLYLVTPLLRQILTVLCRKQLAVLCAGLLALAIANKFFTLWRGDGPPFAGVLFVPFIGYYLAGYLLATGSRDSRWPWPTLIASIIITALGCGWLAGQGKLNAGTYFYDYFSITTVPAGLAAFALCLRLPKLRLFGWIAPVSFGVYLIHPMWLDLLWQNDLRPTTLHPALAIPLLAMFAFVVSGLLAWLILRVPGVRRVV